jgi:hypothetical protein
MSPLDGATDDIKRRIRVPGTVRIQYSLDPLVEGTIGLFISNNVCWVFMFDRALQVHLNILYIYKESLFEHVDVLIEKGPVLGQKFVKGIVLTRDRYLTTGIIVIG